jgi:FMN phosphatase YigB (HAD superfamily)
MSPCTHALGLLSWRHNCGLPLSSGGMNPLSYAHCVGLAAGGGRSPVPGNAPAAVGGGRLMPLTLEQYAAYLDTRDLAWPAPPTPQPPRARPHLVRMPQVRCVLWNVYGTLLCIPGNEVWFEHPQPFVMNVALDKTIQEFKMWGSMSRKPGEPAKYLEQIYRQVLMEHSSVHGAEGMRLEILADRLWEVIIKRLLQKDYRFDAGFYGSLNEFSRKVAYFFHASLQSTVCYPGAAAAVRYVAGKGLTQGLFADAQCFSTVQLQRGLAAQEPSASIEALFQEDLRILSCDVGARKPSRAILDRVIEVLAKHGLEPGEVLHVGSRIPQDLMPAHRLGMKTALFAGDRESVQATPEQLRDSISRPDVLLTDLSEIAEVVG